MVSTPYPPYENSPFIPSFAPKPAWRLRVRPSKEKPELSASISKRTLRSPPSTNAAWDEAAANITAIRERIVMPSLFKITPVAICFDMTIPPSGNFFLHGGCFAVPVFKRYGKSLNIFQYISAPEKNLLLAKVTVGAKLLSGFCTKQPIERIRAAIAASFGPQAKAKGVHHECFHHELPITKEQNIISLLAPGGIFSCSGRLPARTHIGSH